MDEQKVEISVEEEKIEVKETEQQPEAQQEISAQTTELSTIPQDIPIIKVQCQTDDCKIEFASIAEFEKHLLKVHLKEKPKRDEKGYFLPGNKESVGEHNTGRPCGFCQNRTNVMTKLNLYLQFCRGNVDKKLHIPYLEDIADELDLLTETIYDWMNNDRHKEQHSELVHAVKQMKQMQRSRLLRRTLAEAPTGAIFQLKANHGFIETEKQLLVGDKNTPIETVIRIVEEKPNPNSE